MKKLTVFNAYFTTLSRSFYFFAIRRVFVTGKERSHHDWLKSPDVAADESN